MSLPPSFSRSFFPHLDKRMGERSFMLMMPKEEEEEERQYDHTWVGCKEMQTLVSIKRFLS